MEIPPYSGTPPSGDVVRARHIPWCPCTAAQQRWRKTRLQSQKPSPPAARMKDMIGNFLLL
eukprot:1317519-Amorphochlora_amoeboformis.AAC.1